jgi:hypothetical protein
LDFEVCFPRYVELMEVPTIAAYGDDYPHAKFYIACLEDATGVDLKAQEVPIEAIDSGKTSFSNINFPDNFFDVVISGYPNLLQIYDRSMHFMVPEQEYSTVLAECYRVLKPG